MTAKETQKPPLKNLFLIMSVFSVCVHVCPVVHGCQERASFPELELEVVAICPMCGLEPKWSLKEYTLVTPDAFLQTPTPLLLKCNFDIGMFTDLQASGSNKDLNLGTLPSCPGQEIDQQQVISLPGFFRTFLSQSNWDTLGFPLHEFADLGQGWWESIACPLTKGFMAQVQDLASVS